MSIQFPCSFCRRLLRVPAATAGLLAQCPACGQHSPIPFTADDPLPPGIKGTGTFCAEHPEGRSGKRCLSPFSPPAGDNRAIASIGLGIFSLFLSLFGCCFGPLVLVTLPMSIAGCVLGVKSLRAYGRGSAAFGIIVSGAALLISVFAVIVWTMLMHVGRGW